MSERVYDALVHLPLVTGSRGDGIQPLRDLDSVRSFLSGVGPIALFDLPWMPVYLAICFAFHFYIGLTALVGAHHSRRADDVHRNLYAPPGARRRRKRRARATPLPKRAAATPKCWWRWAWPAG